MGKRRYEVGLEKLNHAESQVSIMQASLEALQPALIVAAANVQATLSKVESESAEAAEVEKTVMADEEIANEQVIKIHFSLKKMRKKILLGGSCPSYQRRMRRKFSRSNAYIKRSFSSS